MSLIRGVSATSVWTDLGAGGCRETGGRYEKQQVEKGLADSAACRSLCEADEACTATVFGTQAGETFCHLLSGGPYTHTDGGMSGFVCQVRSLNCSLPEADEAMVAGYDVRECAGARSGSVPRCNMKCSFGYSGTPVARCLRDGGYFQLDGCARLSLDWAFHGGRSCSALGAPVSTASQTSVTLVACMSACQERSGCASVTYDVVTSRCDLFPEPPLVDTAVDRASSSPSARECWRLGAASLAPELAEQSGFPVTVSITALPGRTQDGDNDDEVTIPVSMAPLLFVGGLLTGIAATVFILHYLGIIAVTTGVCFMRRRPGSCDLEQGGAVATSVEPVGADVAKSDGSSFDRCSFRDAVNGTTYIEPFEATKGIDAEKKQALRAVGSVPPGGSPRSCGSTSTRASTPPVAVDSAGPAEASVPEPPAPAAPSPTYAWMESGAPSLRESRTRLPPLVDAPHAGRALPTVKTDAFPSRTRSLGAR